MNHNPFERCYLCSERLDECTCLRDAHLSDWHKSIAETRLWLNERRNVEVGEIPAAHWKYQARPTEGWPDVEEPLHGHKFGLRSWQTDGGEGA